MQCTKTLNLIVNVLLHHLFDYTKYCVSTTLKNAWSFLSVSDTLKNAIRRYFQSGLYLCQADVLSTEPFNLCPTSRGYYGNFTDWPTYKDHLVNKENIQPTLGLTEYMAAVIQRLRYHDANFCGVNGCIILQLFSLVTNIPTMS